MEHINVAAIVINYFDKPNVLALINNFNKIEIIDKIFVVNNSPEETFNKNDKLFKKTILLEPKINLSFSAGNNLALKYIKENFICNYVLIINSDIILEKKDFLILYEEISKNKNIGLISCLMKDTNDKVVCNYWNFMNFKECFCECFYFLKKYGRNSTNLSSGINDVDVVRMSCCLCDFNSLDMINFFDDRFFLFFEEDKLCYKLHKINKRVCLINNIFYIHNHPKSKDFNKSLRYLIRIKKYYFDSLYIYAKDYLNLNIIKKIILKIAVTFSKVEKIFFVILRKL